MSTHNLKRPLLITAMLLLISVGMVFSNAYAAPRIITHNKAINTNQQYSVGLLELALSYFPDKYRLMGSDEFYEQAKHFEEFRAGNISVVWAGTDKTLEQQYRPIRIPLFKGLLGHRIFIIRQGDQGRFNGITRLEDLKRIKLGQGRAWADTAILKHAGLNVVTTNKYVNLFPMLEGGRFDAFPRGAQEPWSEVADWKQLNLTVEKNLVLVYRMPLYFFVLKQQQELGDDLQSGLNQAIADGSFDRYFFANELVRDVLQKADLGSRRAFYLDNPNMSPQTPVDRQELWLDINSLSDYLSESPL